MVRALKVELLVSEWCPTCPQAERVWRRVATEREIELAVVDLAQPEGRELAQRLRIRTIPAVVIDGTLKAVGVQEPEEARAMVAGAPPRRRRSPLHAGMLLSDDNRWFICGAMVWLIAAGAWIAIEGGLVTADRLRPAGTHLFGAGFVLSLIYGLGAHMLPRFTGNPIASGAVAWAQFASLNAGVVLFIAGAAIGMPWLIVSGGALIWTSLALHAWRIWPVLWPRRKLVNSDR